MLGLLYPMLGWGVWYLLSFAGSPVSAEAYIIVSFSLAGVLTVLFFTSSVTQLIPTKKDEEISQLLQLQEEYLTLYDHSPVPYITLDRSGVIKIQNLAAVRLFETTIDALPGVPVTELFVPTEESDPTALQAAVLEHRSIADQEVQIKTSRGELRWVTASLLVFSEGRENLLAMVDITKAKEVDAAKSEFVALATHQLRTPLAAIRWNAELLEQQIADSLSEAGREYLQKVQRNVTRMADLINDFLSASQLEMGTFSTSQETIDLNQFFDSIIEEFAGRIKNAPLTVERSYHPEHAKMVGDMRLLHIVVSNLVSNAVKYTPDNGTVAVSYHVVGSEVVITVSDSGIGIPQAEQSRLFSKFFRAANAREKQAEGTGLGLYVVQQSVHKMHGRIEFESNPDNGTKFTVHLPYQSG